MQIVTEETLCECGHEASRHDEQEGPCAAKGCECEAMEPVAAEDLTSAVESDRDESLDQ